MKFNILKNKGYFFSSYQENLVTVTQDTDNTPKSITKIDYNVIVTSDQIIDYPHQSLEGLGDYIELIVQKKIEIILLAINSLDNSRLHHNKILYKLNQKNIGWEFMNIKSCCKSFNYLNAEGRNTLALILFESHI